MGKTSAGLSHCYHFLNDDHISQKAPAADLQDDYATVRFLASFCFLLVFTEGSCFVSDCSLSGLGSFHHTPLPDTLKALVLFVLDKQCSSIPAGSKALQQIPCEI